MHCLDESMQILTSQGFLGLQQIEQQLEKQEKQQQLRQQQASVRAAVAQSAIAVEPLLRVAEYDPVSLSLRYVVLDAANLVKQPVEGAGGMVELTCAEEALRWASPQQPQQQHKPPASDEKTSALGSGVSLLVTPDHDLFVSTSESSGGSSEWSGPSKIKAEQLLPLHEQEGEHAQQQHMLQQRHFRFVDFAEGGLEAPSAQQDSVHSSGEVPHSLSYFAQHLGLTEQSQVVAFCSLYGYWLAASASGFLPTAAAAELDTVTLPTSGSSQNPSHTATWLREQLEQAGLQHGDGWTTTADATASPDDWQTVCISDARWSSLFAQLQQQRATAEELLMQLSKPLSRALLAGFAVGSEAGLPVLAGEHVLTLSSARMRDDLLRVCLHAGYSVRFQACHSSTSDSWQIVYSERASSSTDNAAGMIAAPSTQQSVLDSTRDKLTRVPATGKHSWCVKVPSGLIVVRRAEVCPATGQVLQASRPIVAGNCFDDVRAILFCVNLAGYNQVRRRTASLSLHAGNIKLVWCEWLCECSCVSFLACRDMPFPFVLPGAVRGCGQEPFARGARVVRADHV